MEHHKHQFYALWNAVSGIHVHNFDVDTMEAEDLLLAENMVGEGLTRLMELKTRIENAKFKLQSSDLQRGNVPQAEEREEGLSIEAYSCEAETERLIKSFRSQPIRLCSKEENESYKAHFGQTEDSVGRIPKMSSEILKRASELRDSIEGLLHSAFNGGASHGRQRK